MHAVLRPYVTAGVSLIGASAIAISPISPVPAALPDIYAPAHAVSTAAVNLVASPIDFYTQVFARTTTNLGQLAGTLIGDPAPILTQIVANQVANADALIVALAQGAGNLVTAVTVTIPQQLRTASVALANGDVETALNALLDIPATLAFPLLDTIYDAIVTPIMLAANRINNIIQNTTGTIILAGAIAIMGPVISTIGSIGSAVQGVIDAAGTGDIVKVVQAVVNAPGVVIDGFLNGGYGPLLMGYIPAPGILDSVTGPIAAILGIRKLIAQQLAPAPLPFANDEALRGGVGGQGDVVSFDAKNAALETGPVVDVQVDPAAEVTGTDSGTGDTDNNGGTGGAEAEGAGTSGGTDPSEGDGGDPAGTPGDANLSDGGDEGEGAGAPDGRTDLSKGNKAVPGKAGATSNLKGKGAPEVAPGPNTVNEPTVNDDDANESPAAATGPRKDGADKTGGDSKTGDKDGDS